MQVDFDVDILMETIQGAAIRRSLYVAYMPMKQQWVVNNPMGGKIVGSHARLENIFEVLDRWEIVNDPPGETGSPYVPARMRGS